LPTGPRPQKTAGPVFTSLSPVFWTTKIYQDRSRSQSLLAGAKNRTGPDFRTLAGSVKPKRGQGNITCWNCDKVGHYSFECEEPEKSDNDLKDDEKASKDNTNTTNDATAVTMESDDECGGAWAAEEVEEELDWFENTIVEMDRNAKFVVKEIPVQDWLDNVVEGENKSRDEGVDSEGALVDGFGRDTSRETFIKGEMVMSGIGACKETILEDSSITGQVWPVCDDVEGTDRLSGALVGLIAPATDLEGEYGDVRYIYGKSSGLGPDLDVFGNPWIEGTTMEWSNHAIALQASAEVVTHPSEDHKGGDFSSDMQMGVKRCDVGVIEVTKDLGGPEMSTVYEKYPLVPCFKGRKVIDAKRWTYQLPSVTLPKSSSLLLKSSIALPNRCSDVLQRCHRVF
jgi:hypothetical protein